MSYQDEYVGSFPKDFSYGPFEQNGENDNASLQEDHKPRILLMGLRRSGKSSIQKVVFHKMSPNETLFLESTNKIVKDDINNSSFVQFQIWDFPGQIDFFDSTFDSDTIFGGCGALVFVIDAQDDYQDALDKLQLTVTKAYRVNSNIKFEVFIHKVDGLNDDYKMESQRDIHHRANEDLAEAGLEHVHLSFHLTSIYDHSIFEAFSKVVQKLIPQLPTLENLLNILISNSGIEKAFLFDVVSKIYIATDSSPVDMQSYELCCDMIDVVIDISCIYGMVDETEVTTTFNSQSSSLIKLNNGTVLYLREVNKFLALVCILREENFQKQEIQTKVINLLTVQCENWTLKMDNELLDISTSLWLQVGYGIGHILNDVCASLWFTYFLVFFHLVLEFTAAQAGYLMLIGQVVDALFTPFIGYHSDHTNNFLSARYGRRKLWHLFGTLCVLSSFPFIFMQCVECSTTHKWAQMFYYAAFITIFQIGWASVQISHLSLIPELAEDLHVRTHLTAIRYGFTVFSNLFVYLITWIILHLTGECDKEQVGPADVWKFRNIMFIVLAVGTLASTVFHFTVSEKQQRSQLLASDNETSTVHCDMLRKGMLYQVAGIYMSTRLVVNISQVLIPLYLHRTLGLAARSLAVVPLAMYLGSLAAAGLQRLAPRSFTRKLSYLLGAACAMSGLLWIYFESDDTFKVYFIYVVAVLIGFGGAQMLVTSLSLTADLVGAATDASAFVYGLMSFTDKLSCGAAIALIQMYADYADASYYRYALSSVCGIAAALGLALTLALPSVTHESLLLNSSLSVNDDEDVPASPRTLES